MSRKGRKAENEAIWLNNSTYNMYYNRLTELGLAMFEWKNLPDTIDERFLELCLLSDGMAVWFYDEVIGYLALQVMIGGQLNVYRIPDIRVAYATNGYQHRLSGDNSVIVFNNFTHTNCLLDIEMYARRLYEIERAIDVNVRQQKTPKIVRCTENQRLVMKNLMMQYDGNEPFIFGDKDLDMTGIEVLGTDSPYVADKLEGLKKEVMGEALTYFGIESSKDKKERQISAEAGSDLGYVEAQRFTRLNARQQACKMINEKFGLDIWVDYRKTGLTLDLMKMEMEAREQGALNQEEEGEEIE